MSPLEKTNITSIFRSHMVNHDHSSEGSIYT